MALRKWHLRLTAGPTCMFTNVCTPGINTQRDNSQRAPRMFDKAPRNILFYILYICKYRYWYNTHTHIWRYATWSDNAMLPKRVIDHVTKILVPGMRNLHLNCWSGGSKWFPQTICAVAVALGYLKENEDKSLLLKTLHTWNTELGKFILDLTRKPLPAVQVWPYRRCYASC